MAGDVAIVFSADTGPLEVEFAKARAEVQALTRELNKTAKEMRSTGGAADPELVHHINALGESLAGAKGNFSELNQTMKAHKAASEGAQQEVFNLLAKFRQLTEGITGLHEAFSSASEAFAAAFAVHEIEEWINSTQEAAEKVEQLSAETGLSAANVQRLGAVFKLAGIDGDQALRGLGRMELGLAHINTSTSAARAGLQAFGINVEQFRAESLSEQLDDLADHVSRFADGVRKTAALEALNRDLVDLTPLLDRGKEGFNELKRAASAAGVVMSDQDVKALAESKEESAKLSLAIASLSRDFESKLDPQIEKSTGLLTKMVGVLDLAIQHMDQWGAIITAEGAAEGGLPPPAYGPPSSKSADRAAGDNNLGAGRDITVHPRPQPGALTLGGTRGGGKGRADHSDEQQAREAYQTEADAARNAAMATLDTLDNEVRQHKISWDEWAKDSTAALEKEKAAIEAAASEALKSESLTSIEKQRIANEEARAIAEISKREADDAAKAAEETQRAWDSFFKPFNSAIESQVSSVLEGHETIRQSFVKMIDTMIGDLAKFAVQWALHEAEMVAVHAAGNAQIAASDNAANAVSLGTSIAKFASQIPAEIGQVIAGVSAFMAPLVGPAAPAVGIAAGAAVQGATHFDIGAWEIPEDMRAVVHRGELVMPSAEAGAFRDMLGGASRGGGGAPAGAVAIHPTVNINHSSLDGPSAASFWRESGPNIMKSIDQAVRHGAHLGLKRLNGR